MEGDGKSSGDLYELENVKPGSTRTSGNFDTLDTFSSKSSEHSHAQSLGTDFHSNDGHDVQLLATDVLRRKKILRRAVVAAGFALLIVALAVTIFVSVSSHPDEKLCTEVIKIPNGKLINSTGSKHGNTVKVECNIGSKLVGHSVITCLSTNTWSDKPKCIPKHCDDIVAMKHVTVISEINSTAVGAEIIVRCEEGFLPKESKVIVCQSNETWSESLPCEAVDCGLPENVTNGQFIGLSTMYNSSVAIICNEGYTLDGIESVRCTSNGYWSDVPKCVPVSCGVPNIPINGHLIYLSGVFFNAKGIVKCAEDYIINGDSNIYCSADGTWTEIPRCAQIVTDCGQPSVVRNGHIIGLNGTHYKSTFTVECDVGFEQSGDKTVRCDAKGNWSAFTGCAPVSCGIPNIPRNGSLVSMNGTVYTSTATMRCNEGFMIAGEAEIRCLSIGYWTISPSCTQKFPDCGTPANIINGNISGLTSTFYGGTFTVQCHDGYTLSIDAVVKCVISGNWTDSPSCIAVSCGIPVIPSDGSIVKINGTTVNSVATLKCDAGFSLVGEPELRCLGNGSWTDSPTCTKLASDCYEIRKAFNTSASGIYDIFLWNSKKVIKVFCDMETNGGGWTVFQNRFNGSVDFYNNYSVYENGFGNLQGEFWLGLKYIYEMVSQGESELRLDLTAADNDTAYENFRNFFLDRERGYRIYFSKGTGTAGDGSRGLSYNSRRAFSTYDYDNDVVSRNCAVQDHGGWWYGHCTFVNLNGDYITPGTVHTSHGEAGVIYYTFKGAQSLKKTKMMFRRV